jgi:hypothetical protein
MRLNFETAEGGYLKAATRLRQIRLHVRRRDMISELLNDTPK